VKESASRCDGIEPLIDGNSTVLILGTIPGGMSLSKDQYYADPRNQFWKIMHAFS
jgi:double-stranded uracil-DNA glycosylase